MDPSDLTHQLLGVAPFTKVGCEAHFTNTSASITKDGLTVLTGSKSPNDTLWTVDLTQINSPGSANLALRTQSIQERVNYFQCLLGNRPISSMVTAFSKNFIRNVEGWPSVISSQYQTHAYNIPAISVGHLQEQRQHVSSTIRDRSTHVTTPIDPSPDTDINLERPHIWLRRRRKTLTCSLSRCSLPDALCL